MSLEGGITGQSSISGDVNDNLSGSIAAIINMSGSISGFGGGGEANIIEKTITENGTYDATDEDADGYNPVIVNTKTIINLESKDDYDELTEDEKYSGDVYRYPVPVEYASNRYRLSYMNENYTKMILTTRTLTQNGVFFASTYGADGYAFVTVAVPGQNLQPHTFNINGTYPASDFGVDGFSSVTINVPQQTPTTFNLNNGLIADDVGTYITTPLTNNLVQGKYYIASINDNGTIYNQIFKFTGSTQLIYIEDAGYSWQLTVTESTISLSSYPGAYRPIYCILSLININADQVY